MSIQFEIFRDSVANYSRNIVLEYFDRTISYLEMGSVVSSLALQLGKFVRKGDVIAVSLQNVPQFVLLEYAAWKLGCIFLPLNPMYTERELQFMINDAGVSLIVCLCETFDTVVGAVKNSGKNIPILRTNAHTFHRVPQDLSTKWKIVDGPEDLSLNDEEDSAYTPSETSDPALLVYTSGTTGEPKGALITHGNIFASASIYRRWFQITPADKVLGVAPFFHITGLVFHIAAAILSGGSIFMEYRFDPELALRSSEAKKTTITMIAATGYSAMLSSGALQNRDLSTMRLWSSGGMPVPRYLEENWKQETGKWIYIAWGLTETTSPSTLWRYPHEGPLPLDHETNFVSSGVAVDFTELKIVDTDDPEKESTGLGEIAVKGPQVIQAYLNRPEATQKTIVKGWLLTGDIGKIVNGNLYVIDRKKDIINVSGFKVWPREVEDVLLGHPDVEEVAVVGIPDPYRGETVEAFIKLKNGLSPSHSLDESIMTLARRNLAAFKVPRKMEFVKEIPKTSSGKIMRRYFRDLKKSD
ncbi:MAG: AMP-binding protein [Nitrososphaerales archaeon]